MTNTDKLNELIRQKGVKKGYLAERLGVSRTTFCALLGNKTEFKASQIRILCEELGIEDDETVKAIFFAHLGA
jgi:DNA-binding Xre family transcriptional regulator